MIAVSRRHLLAAGGAGVAATALAACGEEEDPREEGRDVDLLRSAYGQETGLSIVYSRGAPLSDALPPEEQRTTLAAFARASNARVRELERLIQERGGDTGGIGATADARAIQLANGAIEQYRTGAGLLSAEDLRAVAIRNLAAVAAELAVLREFNGEDPVPSAFVTGSNNEPFVAEEDSDATEEAE